MGETARKPWSAAFPRPRDEAEPVGDAGVKRGFDGVLLVAVRRNSKAEVSSGVTVDYDSRRDYALIEDEDDKTETLGGEGLLDEK